MQLAHSSLAPGLDLEQVTAEFPLANLAAVRLRPFLDQANQGLVHKHTQAATGGSGIPKDVMETVLMATAHLDHHILELRRLMIQEPDKKTQYEEELQKAQTVSNALIGTVSTIGISEAVTAGKSIPH